MVQDAHPDDRVELASLEAFAGLDVPDHDSARSPTRSRAIAAVVSLSSTATSSQPLSSSLVVNSPVPHPSSRQRTPGASRAGSVSSRARRSARSVPAGPDQPQTCSSPDAINSPCRRSVVVALALTSAPDPRDLGGVRANRRPSVLGSEAVRVRRRVADVACCRARSSGRRESRSVRRARGEPRSARGRRAPRRARPCRPLRVAPRAPPARCGPRNAGHAIRSTIGQTRRDARAAGVRCEEPEQRRHREHERRREVVGGGGRAEREHAERQRPDRPDDGPRVAAH